MMLARVVLLIAGVIASSGAQAQLRDGHWETKEGGYRTAMTSLAGMALLMEGSNLEAGKYSDNIHRAVDWLLDPFIALAFPSPKIAFIPVFILWFGIDSLSKILLVGFACVFPIVIGTHSAVRAVNRHLVWSAASLGTEGLALVTRIILPASFPRIVHHPWTRWSRCDMNDSRACCYKLLRFLNSATTSGTSRCWPSTA